MTNEDMSKLIGNIREKAGEEVAGLIADDLGTLITENEATNQVLAENQKIINTLKEDKENLISTNGNLLKRISMDANKNPFQINENKEEKKQEYSIHKAFDSKGKFI